MNQQKLCFFFILFFANPLWAAKWSAPPKDNLGVKFGASAPSLSTKLTSSLTKPDTEVIYNPNDTGSVYLSLSYQNLGLTIGGIHFPKNEKEQQQYDDSVTHKGTTTHTDYQLRFYGKYASTEFFYQKYKGYFIENSSEIDPTYHGISDRIKRPDLSTEHWGAQIIYNFNPDNFSMAAAYDQFSRQKESGGSWLGLVYVDHHRILADTAWTPSQVSSLFPTSKDFDDGLAVTAGVGGGYGFTLTAGNFYLSGLFIIGLGPQVQKYSGGTEPKEISAVSRKIIARPSMGYNGETNYFGIQVLADAPAYAINEQETLEISTVEYSFFYGHRFDGVSIPPAEWVSELID